jgi:DNA modification methylase
MKLQQNPKKIAQFTFKGNAKRTRYGWLRLTPSYSIHLVKDILERYVPQETVVLDPFCGTGTTALVCSEQGIDCDTVDINPFLVWLAQTKAQQYTNKDLDTVLDISIQVEHAMGHPHQQLSWLPPLHQIDKWWDKQSLVALSNARQTIEMLSKQTNHKVINLLKVAFCRTLIESSNACFGHQSMSFKKKPHGEGTEDMFGSESLQIAIVQIWKRALTEIVTSAYSPIMTRANFLLGDARTLSRFLKAEYYSLVITSPPYPNRISYIRELRPYMYWLGYLQDKRSAGELDWQAIGGTWGIATSRVARWEPFNGTEIPFEGFETIIQRIEERSSVLARYVHKYFYDIVSHCQELFLVLKHGGSINYIVGNSKFYDVMLPVEDMYASIFTSVGFKNVTIETIRKRTSKKELFEFLVSGTKP